MIRKAAILLVSLLVPLLLAALWLPGASGATPARPPVVLVGGTFEQSFQLDPIKSKLTNDGFDVSVFVLPGLGLGDIRTSSAKLAEFVDGVRARTGAERVSMVTHSQGALEARHYIKYLGGQATVDKVVMLAAPNYGTALTNLISLIGAGNCLGVTACTQMEIGSDYLKELNAGPDVIDPVRYTNLYTLGDEIIVPATNARMDGAVNLALQEQCPLHIVGHLGTLVDGTAYSGVRQALEGQPIHLDCRA